MIKDSFLDTNVIINYVNYAGETSKNIIKKCYFYILRKKGSFILCAAVIEELSKLREKRARIHKAVLKKMEDKTFSFEDTLPERDQPFAKKLYHQFKDEESAKLSREFSNERAVFEMSIESFLKFKVDKKVIPLEQIDIKLTNKIREVIRNYTDCKILASALQYQKSKKIFLFVTADGEDFDSSDYAFLKNYNGLEPYKFPKLLNLLFNG